MITKQQYARNVVDRFKKYITDTLKAVGFDNKEYTDESLVKFIHTSTRLGIALETLGVITHEKYPDEYEYLQSRAGIMEVYADKDTTNILTMREFIAMLPDEISSEES